MLQTPGYPRVARLKRALYTTAAVVRPDWGQMVTTANFDFLRAHDPTLVRLGGLAERYFRDDPATASTTVS